MAAVKTKRPTKAPSKKLKAGKKKPLNKWLILGGVAAVAIIGVAIVRFSSASTITFLRSISQISKASFTQGRVNYDYVGQANSPATTIVSTTELKKSKKVCAKISNFNKSGGRGKEGWTAVVVRVMSSSGGNSFRQTSSARAYVHSGKTVHVCAPVYSLNNARIEVYSNDKTSNQDYYKVGIAGIYGSR